MLPVMLLLSILFALIPLAGIVWIAITKSLTSVDGLFMSLILLTLSGVFLLNAALETPPLRVQPAHGRAGPARRRRPAAYR